MYNDSVLIKANATGAIQLSERGLFQYEASNANVLLSQFLTNVLMREQLYASVQVNDATLPAQSSGDVSGHTVEQNYLLSVFDKAVQLKNATALVVEVGSWRGQSTISMAKMCLQRRRCHIIAIDTWLGSSLMYSKDR